MFVHADPESQGIGHKMRKNFLLAALMVALTGSLASAAEPKRKNVAPAPTAAPASVPIDAVPTGTLQLLDLGKGTETPAQNWLELGSIAASGKVRTIWMLAVLPKDQQVNGKSAAASWGQFEIECTVPTITPLRLVFIDARGTIVQQMGPFPKMSQVPTLLSTARKLATTACYPPKSPPVVAVSAIQAVQWTRNPSLAAAASSRPVQAAAKLTPAPIPTGKLQLVDFMIDIGRSVDEHRLYIQRGGAATDAGGVWTLEVTPTDRPYNIGGASAFPSAGMCTNRKLSVRHAAIANKQGEIETLPVTAFPPSKEVFSTSQGSLVKLPAALGAVEIFDQACPADMMAAMSSNIKKGLQPTVHASAAKAIEMARRASTLTANERASAIPCLALARATAREASSIGSDNWQYVDISYKMQALDSLLARALGQVDNIAVQSATAKWSAKIAAAKAAKSPAPLAPDLNRCIATVPLDVEPHQFN